MRNYNILKLFLVAALGLTFVLSSCKEKVTETLQVLIQNRTDGDITVTLYPKKTTTSGELYPMCEGCGGYKKTKFTLKPERYYDWDGVIYYTSDLNMKPYILTSIAFDSIYISTSNQDKVIKFTHSTVYGYSENPFTENSTWEYYLYEWSRKTNSRSFPEKNHCFIFIISEDKIFIE